MPKKEVRKSAVKNHRQSERARLRHKAKRSALSTIEKKLRAAVAAQDKTGAAALLAQFQASLDKAAKTVSIHGNKAKRKKSRLASLVATIGKTPAAEAPKA